MAKHQVELIRDGPVVADPDSVAACWTNSVSCLKDLEGMDDRRVPALANCRHDAIMTCHQTFAYLMVQYDLSAATLTGLAGDCTVGTANVTDIAIFINDTDADCTLAEFGVDQRNFEVLAEGTGVQVLTSGPTDGMSQKDLDSGATHIYKMLENPDVLEVALDCN